MPTGLPGGLVHQARVVLLLSSACSPADGPTNRSRGRAWPRSPEATVGTVSRRLPDYYQFATSFRALLRIGALAPDVFRVFPSGSVFDHLGLAAPLPCVALSIFR